MLEERLTRQGLCQGYFRTGDIAAWRVKDGCYAILGRASADIIKTSGHKVSALEVERTLLEHPEVEEAAVLGVEDPLRGQAIVAVVTLRQVAQGKLSAEADPGRTLREFCKTTAAPEKV